MFDFLRRKVNRTNDDLVDRIERVEAYDAITRPPLRIDDPRILAAMRRVDRKMFIPENVTTGSVEEYYLFGADVPEDASEVPAKACAYTDLPVHIGQQMTCSQPSLIAYMIQLLEVEQGMKVLEIGSGCCYAAAILAELGARVIGLERVFSLHCLGQKNVEAHFGPDGMRRVMPLWVNGFQGFPAAGHYDRIMISAQPPKGFDPRPLAEQLREQTGIILFPNDGLIQQRYDNGMLVERKRGPEVRFVPLVEKGREYE